MATWRDYFSLRQAATPPPPDTHEATVRFYADAAGALRSLQSDGTDAAVGGGSLPAGGTTGEVLTKASNADGDADWEAGGGSQPPGALSSDEFLFTEEATAGTYTATLPILAGTMIEDIRLYNLSDPSTGAWAADTAVLSVTDSTEDYYSTVSLGADLLAEGMDNPYPGTLDFSAARSIRWRSVMNDGTAPWEGFYKAALASWDDDLVRNPAGNGTTLALTPAFNGVGLRYSADDLITMQVVTAIGSPPVVPTGVLLVKVIYFAPVTTTDAAFA